ncbi:hypothetical protein OG906_02345 [Streptomyces sp. NBC_01426]|uniref:hypothetical protein n=1 Tax=unclassified Streptomyces TaxID=2593676 RepID=UPI002E328311|nr:hypothetical protein [Streptomyces sp. NBC_01426]
MEQNEAAAGLAELEGYLMSRAAHHTAAVEAHAFADELPWLGRAEREDVVHLYTARHLARTRNALYEIAGRSHELREEYARRYQLLRRRVVALALVGGTTVLTTVLALLTIGLKPR